MKFIVWQKLHDNCSSVVAEIKEILDLDLSKVGVFSVQF